MRFSLKDLSSFWNISRLDRNNVAIFKKIKSYSIKFSIQIINVQLTENPNLILMNLFFETKTLKFEVTHLINSFNNSEKLNEKLSSLIKQVTSRILCLFSSLIFFSLPINLTSYFLIFSFDFLELVNLLQRLKLPLKEFYKTTKTRKLYFSWYYYPCKD